MVCGGGGVCNTRDNANLRYAYSIKVSHVGDKKWEGGPQGRMTIQVLDVEDDPIVGPNMGLDYSSNSWFFNDDWWYYDEKGRTQSWCVSRSNGGGRFTATCSRSFSYHWGSAYSECTVSVPNGSQSVTLWGASYSDYTCEGQPRVLGWNESAVFGAHGDNGDHYATGDHTQYGGQWYSEMGAERLWELSPMSDQPPDWDDLKNSTGASAAAMSGGASTSSFAVAASGLQVQAGDRGQGYAKSMPEIAVANVADPVSMHTYGRPYQYSWTVALATPVDMLGKSYPVTIETASGSFGMRAKQFKSSDDDKVHEFVTDYFVVVDDTLTDVPPVYTMYDQWTVDGTDPNSKVFEVEDPNFYMTLESHVADNWCKQYDPNGIVRDDPNMPQCDFERMYDPNRIVDVYTVLVSPSEPNDLLTIIVDVSPEILLEIGPYWLSDDENADLNDDGIVDMIDFALMQGI
jgi:hypothetical protein